MDAEDRDFGIRQRLIMGAGAVAFAILGWALLDPTPARRDLFSDPDHPAEADGRTGSHPVIADTAATREINALAAETRELRARLRAMQPRSPYIVVDRANNRIYLRRGDSILMEAPTSTGSGIQLRETGGEKRSWTFETPAGRFSVLSERTDPVWTKPDWAFLEEGKAVPQRLSERREYGTLGEYALDLGDGYMIHWTLYERLLGRSVTHGCVRVGRDALRQIARTAGPGSQVFIF